MGDDPIRFPVTTWQRIKNRRGSRAVHCMVSGRYWTFGKPGETSIPDGTPVTVEVMTSADEDSKDRKLCQLVIALEDLRRMIKTLDDEHVGG